jgi:putative DNA methylase
MLWDFCEANPFETMGSLSGAIDWIHRLLPLLPSNDQIVGKIYQDDARNAQLRSDATYYVISTDPPYYDNIGYADLSDFFYIWLRYSLGKVYPDLFSTLLAPKAQELVATPYRFGGDKRKAEAFFEEGLRQVFANLRRAAHPTFPLTV